MKQLYKSTLLVALVLISSYIIYEYIRPPELDIEFNGTCTDKHAFTNNGTDYYSVTLENGEYNLPWLVTEEQYNNAQIGKNYSYRHYWKNGKTTSYHLDEISSYELYEEKVNE
jgi:hypothetical protein